MSSYSSALRKTIKWYRKIAIELLLGTSMVNAHFLYKEINNSTISITDFRQNVVEQLLLGFDENQTKPIAGSSSRSDSKKKRKVNKHEFRRKEGVAHKVRKYCRGCYSKVKTGNTERNKVPKVTTYCEDCDGKPHYCLECFANFHN